jgi:hypothetical protein
MNILATQILVLQMSPRKQSGNFLENFSELTKFLLCMEIVSLIKTKQEIYSGQLLQ